MPVVWVSRLYLTPLGLINRLLLIKMRAGPDPPPPLSFLLYLHFGATALLLPRGHSPINYWWGQSLFLSLLVSENLIAPVFVPLWLRFALLPNCPTSFCSAKCVYIDSSSRANKGFKEWKQRLWHARSPAESLCNRVTKCTKELQRSQKCNPEQGPCIK